MALRAIDDDEAAIAASETRDALRISALAAALNKWDRVAETSVRVPVVSLLCHPLIRQPAFQESGVPVAGQRKPGTDSYVHGAELAAREEILLGT